MKHTIAIYIGFLLLTACSESKTEETKTIETTMENLSLTEQQIKFNQIQVGKLEQKEIAPLVIGYGKIEVPPQNKQLIVAKYGGFIKKIHVLEGSIVKKGQALIELEDPNLIQMQLDYLDNKSQLEFLDAEYTRQQELQKNDATSNKNLQQAKAAYFSAKAKVTALKEKLHLAGISTGSINENHIQNAIILKAPFDGIVSKINANNGAYVQSQDVLLELIDRKHLHAEVEIYEKDAHRIKEGQEVSLSMRNSDQTVLAHVYLIGYDVSDNKTVKVHCHFDKMSTTMKPGMFFKAAIKTDLTTSYVIPKDGIVSADSKNYVFVEINQQENKRSFKPLEVKIIGEIGNETAIEIPENYSNEHFVLVGAYELFALMKQE